MSRVVVRCSAAGSHEFFETDARHNRTSRGVLLSVKSTDTEFKNLSCSSPSPGVVTLSGDRLRDELRNHADIEALLLAAFQGNSVSPLYLLLDPGSTEAAQLPWESLHDSANAKTFLAIDCRWPVGRLIKSASAQRQHALCVRSPAQRPVLKILAVLSAHRMCHLDEWSALLNAKKQARNNTRFDVELRVMLSGSNFHSQVQNDDPATRCDLPGRVADIQRAIHAFKPHIVHFFCHGSKQDLQIATQSDYQRNARSGTGSISMTPADIVQQVRATKCDTWMVVLNCCDSANSTADTRSLAQQLVCSDIPVVVGMREPVTRSTANEFSKFFYEKLIDHVEASLPTLGAAASVVEWGEIFWQPRKSVCECASQKKVGISAPDYKEWTLPVLYVDDHDFLLDPISTQPQAQIANQIVKKIRQDITSTPGAPDDVNRNLADFDE